MTPNARKIAQLETELETYQRGASSFRIMALVGTKRTTEWHITADEYSRRAFELIDEIELLKQAGAQK